MATYTLHLGDCLTYMRSMPDKSVDAVITDPPYSTPVAVAFGREKVRRLSDLSIQESYVAMLKAGLERVLKDNGRICVFCDDTYFPVLFAQFYEWHNTGVVVWDKGRIGMGNPFRKQHELVLYATRGVFLPEKANVPSVIKCQPVPLNDREHGAQKPAELVGELARAISLEGDTIFDPFMGSGTTGVACMQLGRNFIGCEIEPKYYEIAERRIKEASMQTIMDF